MTYVILNSRVLANRLNKLINNYMKSNISDYNATQWCKILTNNNGKYSVYIKSKDERKPLTALDNTIKNKIVNELPIEFFTEGVPNYD